MIFQPTLRGRLSAFVCIQWGHCLAFAGKPVGCLRAAFSRRADGGNGGAAAAAATAALARNNLQVFPS